MPLPVKFADVSISLKQFQDISSGRHNAGEVRLKDAHTIDKVNHYVSRTGRNKVSLSHAEVIAVKQAFVDALAGAASRRTRSPRSARSSAWRRRRPWTRS